ncbi:hypothetical protein EXIGLDRAFT_106429 [Exidia glandulosa HHB12029]|uniref:Uncharacterized protein n=1 Tax=Exidia glandulosa HHB12029 TaxID=1314781 RepID=A0A165GSG9_EXIGL|nr:hypothetical protein EXIGLDRAFT_106429 [Exidia glandulosa HHB12029]
MHATARESAVPCRQRLPPSCRGRLPARLEFGAVQTQLAHAPILDGRIIIKPTVIHSTALDTVDFVSGSFPRTTMDAYRSNSRAAQRHTVKKLSRDGRIVIKPTVILSRAVYEGCGVGQRQFSAYNKGRVPILHPRCTTTTTSRARTARSSATTGAASSSPPPSTRASCGVCQGQFPRTTNGRVPIHFAVGRTHVKELIRDERIIIKPTVIHSSDIRVEPEDVHRPLLRTSLHRTAIGSQSDVHQRYPSLVRRGWTFGGGRGNGRGGATVALLEHSVSRFRSGRGGYAYIAHLFVLYLVVTSMAPEREW